MDALAVLVDGRHVGNVVVDEANEHAGTARLSIYIGENEFRRQGIAGHAIELAVERARERGLYKLWLTVHAENAAARALYDRVGFVREGILPGEFLIDGRRVDAIRMSLVLSRPQ